MKIRSALLSFALICSFFLSACASSDPLTAIEKGGEWFLNDENENFIHYQYKPATDFHPDASHAMREMGALWSIYNLADFLKDERYDALAQKGLTYFKSFLKEDTANGFTYVNVTPDKIKLGYSAFMILNLLESEDPDKDELMRELADGILYLQAENGRFDTFFYSERDTGLDYYPGEALLALGSLYEYTNEQRYLDAIKNALPYYISYFEENPNTAFVPWQTQAYSKYFLITGDTEASDFVFEMNDYMASHFSEEGESCSPDTESAGIVTAVYMEGMTKAYTVAKTLEDEERADCYARFIRNGAETVMDLQFPMANLNLDDYPEAAIPTATGGFCGSKTDVTMQVDRNQHATMALMRAYELGLIE